MTASPPRAIRALLAILSIISLFPVRTCVAATEAWSGTGPRAKSIEALARDPVTPSRMWAATFGAGVYRTLDGGATWTGYRNGLVNTFVRCFAVQPHQPDSIYCGTNDGVFLSTDGGVNWNKLLSTAHSVRAIAIHPTNPDTILVATYGSGIYRSTNNGKNWSQVNLGLVSTFVRDIAYLPTNPTTVFAATGTGGGMHRSTLSGITWTQLADTTGSLNGTHGAAEQIQISVTDSVRIYVAESDRGVIKSLDNGNTWKRVVHGLLSFNGRSLAIVDTLRYYGSSDRGAFFTTLRDTAWHMVDGGLTNLTVDALLSPASAPSTCWAGTEGGGVYRTDNRGASWSQLDGGLLNTFGFSLAVRPVSPGPVPRTTVYVGTGFGDQFWKSTDNGSTWARTRYIFSHDSEHGVVPDPLLPQTVYASAYGGGVYRSDDDGVTFFDPDSLNLTLTNHFVRDLVAWPGQSGHLFVGSGNGLFETLDGGAHWVPRNGGGLPAAFSVRALTLVPDRPDTLYIGSDSSGVWKTTDGGNNWNPVNVGLPTPFIHTLLADSGATSTVFAACDSGVFKSVNGGASWAPARTGLPYGALGSVRALAQDPHRAAVLFCGVYGSGVYQSQDAGASWTALDNGTLPSLNVRSLVVDPYVQRIYAGTENGVSWTYYVIPGVDAPPIASEARPALFAWPNPAGRGDLHVRYALSRAGRARVEVYSLTGQRVRVLEDRARDAGAYDLLWDTRDAAGRAVPSGIYFIRLASAPGARTLRVAVLAR